MKLIKELEELMEDEIHDVGKYAKMAAELKEKHPSLAQTLYSISTQEDAHQAAIHSEVVKIIDDFKKSGGTPPEAMVAVYEFLHKRHIENLAEARRYQDIYKEK